MHLLAFGEIMGLICRECGTHAGLSYYGLLSMGNPGCVLRLIMWEATSAWICAEPSPKQVGH